MSDKSTPTQPGPDMHGMTQDDYRQLDALTDADIVAAVAADPDAAPLLTPERASRIRPTSLAKIVRLKVPMTLEQFSANYGIPLAKLTAWERHEAQPTETEMHYLRLIERNPAGAKLVPA